MLKFHLKSDTKKLKSIIYTFLIFQTLILSLSPKPSYSKEIGVGIIVGEPTGFSIKYRNFPILGIAWSVENHFHFHVDYWVIERGLSQGVKWYFGVGGKMILFHKDKNDNSDLGLGVRVPIGLQYFITPEFELFGEVAPGMSVIPGTDFDIDGGIGLRYHF